MNSINIPDTDRQRVVIVGAGFAGLKLAKKLSRSQYQVVLIDKNNYHQFQPLLYQVSVAGLEPSSISFPLRKAFQGKSNIIIRNTKVLRVLPEAREIETEVGSLRYDILVLAMGADTNYFGNQSVARHAIPMKSLGEAMSFRNIILEDLEQALTLSDAQARSKYLNIAIVGGGPTGVEVAGALAEMKRYIIPKDYPEIPWQEIEIHLIDSAPKVLSAMSEKSSADALRYLQELGVSVKLNTLVTGYDGDVLTMNDGSSIETHKVIWAAGIRGNSIEGLPETVLRPGNRLAVDRFNRLEGSPDIYVIGDLAAMVTDRYPRFHPQVAQVAMQQATLLAANLRRLQQGEPAREFEYRDKGSMATIGRNKAVADLPGLHFKGFFAWLVWLFVHLMSILGTKNKVFVFINWVWNYLTYDQSLRLILKARPARTRAD